ncbi:propionyl-CoA synthetase [Nakamurella leprariae]|uniref:Propionyl-CoA synthetase n=1 Tax=Nakamurella leprariae TaxID=2803911 RepID=A0A939BXX1_9ACTN|nr:propionyl-CoA synthetase [Nakamurella leprariae]MBM9466450.1 propionyl-CoA synthetase [Nakamurella leprariae]
MGEDTGQDHRADTGDYRALHALSLQDPETFWLDAARTLDWDTPPERALDDTQAPFFRWFPGGRLNVCANAVDRHVAAGRGDQVAVVHDSPVTGTQRSITYADLLDQVSRFAGVLRGLGVERGDRVVIYLPMIPEAVVAMLACARLGAIHSVVFGGFAPRELALRIDDATPKVIVTASCGIEVSRVLPYVPMVREAIALAGHTPDATVVLQRPQSPAELTGAEHDWEQAMTGATPADPVPVASSDPLYILYTSGTTGKPKGVVRDSGGYATALAWTMRGIYDVGVGQTMFTASDVGWVVGHSYCVYAPLLAGATTVIYEGKPVGTPDAGQFWRVVAEHRVRTMFTAPTAFRAIKKDDPSGALAGRYDLSSLRYLFLAGERLDPETHRWATELLDIPVIDNWWQTETGWPIAADPAGVGLLPIKPGSPTLPMPGWDIQVLDGQGGRVPAGEDGAIVAKLPLPPGALLTVWQDDERFVRSYLSAFDGYYLSGDGGHLDEDGYVFVMGRTDDVINVAGHRLSTGGMEEVLASHPDVAECAVIGVSDALKGQVPRGFVVLKSSVDTSEPGYEQRLQAELVQLVRDRIGAVAALREVLVVPGLPKTRSGKILRRTMRGIADGADEPVPSTIDDVSVLETLRPMLRQ